MTDYKLTSVKILQDLYKKFKHKALTDEGVVRQTARRKASEQRKLDKASGNQKLKDLGLTDDEIKAVTGT